MVLAGKTVVSVTVEPPVVTVLVTVEAGIVIVVAWPGGAAVPALLAGMDMAGDVGSWGFNVTPLMLMIGQGMVAGHVST